MKKVLIVDDERRIREIYVQLLQAMGLTVLSASDAREATNIIIREPVDLVLLDINMPYVDGKQMFDMINEYNPNLRVIVSSIYPPEQQKRLIPCATDYYDKSQGLFFLVEKITNILFADQNHRSSQQQNDEELDPDLSESEDEPYAAMISVLDLKESPT